MVAVKAPNNPIRPPFLPSEKDQQNNGCHVQARQPRGKQVPSRYLSPSPSSSTTTTTSSSSSSSTATSSGSNSCSFSASISKRFPSPLLSRSTNYFSTPKRSQSVDRKRPLGSQQRPITPNSEAKQGSNASKMSAATRMLITSTRSLSVSFQGEAFSLLISKATAVSSSTPNMARKAIPERRKLTPVSDHGENSKPLDQHRWPGRRRDGNLSLIRDKRSVGSGLMSAKSSQQSPVANDRRLSLDLGIAEQTLDVNSSANKAFVTGDLTVSDSDSFCSRISRSGTSGISVSARFWQETNGRLRRLQDPSSPLSTSPSPRMSTSSKSKRFSSDARMASPRTIGASPIREATRPASPSKFCRLSASSPSRGMSSPSRVRPMSSDSSSTHSIRTFSIDWRRGKIGEDRIVDAHILRLLYNRYLQWRFVNERADATFFVQRLNAEKNLWNAWLMISELRHSVTIKRVKLLFMRQKLKLTSILKGQITCLEKWSLLDRDHSTSLEGAAEALTASILRLPIVGKAKADVQNLKDALSSAVYAVHAMASSIPMLSPNVEEINSLAAELVNATAKEKFLLEHCKYLLSTLAGMQVNDCSLRTHIMQLKRLPTTSNLATWP